MKKNRILFYFPVAYSTVEKRIDDARSNLARGELFYGIVELERLGCKVVIPKTRLFSGSIIIYQLYYFWQFLKLWFKYDIIYTPYFNGIEWIIILSGFFRFVPCRKKIAIWHHSPVKAPQSRLGKLKQCFFLKGCDALFFFTPKLMNESISTYRNKYNVIHWGPDLDFYRLLVQNNSIYTSDHYLMSGSDCRDFDTVVRAFSEIPEIGLDMYPPTEDLKNKYYGKYCNINVNTIERSTKGYYKMSVATASCRAVLIITKRVPGRELPSGLTSICEATALGRPCIITENKYFSDEIKEAGFAIFVKEGDIDGIRKSVLMLEQQPHIREKMSAAALEWSKKYDSNNTAKEILATFKKFGHN